MEQWRDELLSRTEPDILDSPQISNCDKFGFIRNGPRTILYAIEPIAPSQNNFRSQSEYDRAMSFYRTSMSIYKLAKKLEGSYTEF
jgi:hypothetical protein